MSSGRDWVRTEVLVVTTLNEKKICKRLKLGYRKTGSRFIYREISFVYTSKYFKHIIVYKSLVEFILSSGIVVKNY